MAKHDGVVEVIELAAEEEPAEREDLDSRLGRKREGGSFDYGHGYGP